MRIIYKVERLRFYQLDTIKYIGSGNEREIGICMRQPNWVRNAREVENKFGRLPTISAHPVILLRVQTFCRKIQHTHTIEIWFRFTRRSHSKLIFINWQPRIIDYSKTSAFFYGCIFHQWICTTELNQFVWTNGFLLFWICFSSLYIGVCRCWIKRNWTQFTKMPGGRRGLVAPQNTFLENIIRRSNSQRKYNIFFFTAALTISVNFFSQQLNVRRKFEMGWK